jgi:hypothetical protein
MSLETTPGHLGTLEHQIGEVLGIDLSPAKKKGQSHRQQQFNALLDKKMRAVLVALSCTANVNRKLLK